MKTSGAAPTTRWSPTSFPQLPLLESRPYTISEFATDQRRLLGIPLAAARDVVELVEGRLRAVYPQAVRAALDGERAERAPVHPARLAHLASVLDFLDERRDELVRCGLARGEDPLMVREEFLDFLLRDRAQGGAGRPAPGTIRDFLDAWGHHE